MADYTWTTFAETDTIATNFGKGLVELGQERFKNIVIFAETRAQWLIAAQSCFKQNFPGTPAYDKINGDIKTVFPLSLLTLKIVQTVEDQPVECLIVEKYKFTQYTKSLLSNLWKFFVRIVKRIGT